MTPGTRTESLIPSVSSTPEMGSRRGTTLVLLPRTPPLSVGPRTSRLGEVCPQFLHEVLKSLPCLGKAHPNTFRDNLLHPYLVSGYRTHSFRPPFLPWVRPSGWDPFRAPGRPCVGGMGVPLLLLSTGRFHRTRPT